MSDKPSITDIIADVRKRAKIANGEPPEGVVHHNAVGSMLDWIANALEAAWREHEASERENEAAKNTLVALLKDKDAKLEHLRRYATASRSDFDHCAACQSAMTGEGYGDVPPKVGFDDRCDKCEVAARLRARKVALFKQGVTLADRAEGGAE